MNATALANALFVTATTVPPSVTLILAAVNAVEDEPPPLAADNVTTAADVNDPHTEVVPMSISKQPALPSALLRNIVVPASKVDDVRMASYVSVPLMET